MAGYMNNGYGGYAPTPYYNPLQDVYKRQVGYYGSMTALAERYLEERQKAIMDDSTVNLDEYVKLVEESNQKAVSRL